MGRKRAGAFDELLTVASKLHWKLDLVLAIAAFFIFHLITLATVPSAIAPKPSEMGALVIQQFSHVSCLFLQFIVPAGLLIGAVVSFIRQTRSIELITKVRGSALQVNDISWEQFESLVGEGFRQRGFRVTERGGRAPDGGIDLEVVSENGRFLVQCKQRRSRQVGVSVIREFFGVLSAEKVSGGWVVTSGTFTEEATRFANANGVQLLDGCRLNEFLQTSPAGPRSSKRESAAKSVGTDAPKCPICRTSMVERVPKRGVHAGNKFWGCANYPQCRKTLPKAA